MPRIYASPAADRAERELRASPRRSDRLIAQAAGCSRQVAARARKALEQAGEIPHSAPGRRERQRPAAARDRASRGLRSNAWRSDGMIARAARVSVPTVRKARHALEAQGKIPRVPPGRRAVQRQRPRPPSPARLAILLGARTSREVADAAHVTVGAGWKALQAEKRRPPIPRPLPPSQPCEHCGQMFIPAARDRPQRYCCRSCTDAAYRRDRHARRPPPEPVPRITALPPFDFSKGTCTHVPASQASWWTSDSPVLREGAAHLCGTCPIAHLCLDWSLAALPKDDNTVYAGLGAADRRAIRAGQFPAGVARPVARP